MKEEQRELTTPERIRMVDSIKKSIHRSVEKINPAEYKSILKGENIYIHLCYKGEVINSEYTKVALFMGAVVYKLALEKTTAVITNDLSNKMVKKLAAMGKPILNVLWLEACFQEKRKVPYGEFIFTEERKDHEQENDSQDDANFNLDRLVCSEKNQIEGILSNFRGKYDYDVIKFADKK